MYVMHNGKRYMFIGKMDEWNDIPLELRIYRSWRLFQTTGTAGYSSSGSVMQVGRLGIRRHQPLSTVASVTR